MAILIFSQHRNWRVWLAWFIPLISYVFTMVVAGAFRQFGEQMLGETSIVQEGIWPYITSIAFWAGMASGMALRFIPPFHQKKFALFILLGAIIVSFFLMASGRYDYHPARLLFGMLSGTLLLTRPRKNTRAAWFILSMAWATSVSVGLNSPALFAGGLFLALYREWSLTFRISLRPSVLAILAVLCFVPFHWARTHHIYRDLPSAELRTPLGKVLRGGALIYTNSHTASLLHESDSIAKASVLPVAFVPLLPAYYVCSPRLNPLPIDWARGIEIADPQVFSQLVSSVEARRGRMVIAVQKNQTSLVAFGKFPIDLDSPQQKFAKWVTDNLILYDETEHYRLFK